MRIRLILLSLLLPASMLTPTRTVELPPQPVSIGLRPDPRLELLNKFFDHYHCPIPNYAEIYISAADKYQLDYRLLPAISISESTCGKHQLYNNWWGYGSSGSLKQFRDVAEGIDYVDAKLAGGSPYAGLTPAEKLKNYGPHVEDPKRPGHYIPSPKYYKEVLKFMDQIDGK